MKNIIYKHLKTCVLSLCVAVSCGDKAFGEPGVYFLCKSCTARKKCKVWVPEVGWRDHYIDKCEKGLVEKYEQPGAFLCGQCKDEGKAQEGAFRYLRELIDHLYTHEEDKKYDIKCFKCEEAFPWRFHDGHITFHACYGKEAKMVDRKPKIYLHCKVCDVHMGLNDWNQHVHNEHRGDFSENIFVCLDCEKYGHQEKGKEICCQTCKDKKCVQCQIRAEEIEKTEEIEKKYIWYEGTDGVFKKGNWDNNVDNTDYCGKSWRCLNCENLQYQEQKGILYCQNCQYVYCQSHKRGFLRKAVEWRDHLRQYHKEDKDSFLLYPSSISE